MDVPLALPKFLLGRMSRLVDSLDPVVYDLFHLFPLGPLSFNSLPNDKFLNWSILKAFADDKVILAQKLKLLLGIVENIVGKGENVGYQHFLLSKQLKLEMSQTLTLYQMTKF